jgi:RNA recognition motif-containing protein
MTVKIYVGNLSYRASDDDLHAAFSQYGEIASAEVVKERETGRSRGFGFVVMPNAAEAQKAIDALDGQEICGRPVRCNEAQERERRSYRDR